MDKDINAKVNMGIELIPDVMKKFFKILLIKILIKQFEDI